MKSEVGSVKRDLPERSFQFALRVVRLCQRLEKQSGVSWQISNQLLRSGTSIGANIEEGQASQSKADFVSKYSIACKEARETHYWLRLLSASEIIEEDRLQLLITEADELIAILTTIIKKTKAGMNEGVDHA
ncbi:MAG: four helix bundle protein [Victivallaceae bacterium]|nr:four helix bundle protein [Victivallaceae bacterium]MDD4181269.1 four helix bundle protein [Victivallaceae bacterium]